jgi:hypothetical protein
MQYCMHACRPTAEKQLANFSARLAGKSAGQGWQARLPGKADCSTRMPFGPATEVRAHERARNPILVEIGRNSKYF